jgi:hypothetical protein
MVLDSHYQLVALSSEEESCLLLPGGVRSIWVRRLWPLLSVCWADSLPPGQLLIPISRICLSSVPRRTQGKSEQALPKVSIALPWPGFSTYPESSHKSSSTKTLWVNVCPLCPSALYKAMWILSGSSWNLVRIFGGRVTSTPCQGRQWQYWTAVGKQVCPHALKTACRQAFPQTQLLAVSHVPQEKGCTYQTRRLFIFPPKVITWHPEVKPGLGPCLLG